MRQGQSVLRHGRTRICTPECQLAAGTTGNRTGYRSTCLTARTGKAVGKCRVCSDPNTIDIALPVGKFDLLLVNNTEEEAGGNQLHGYRQPVDTFKACLAANEEPLYSSLLSKAEGTTRSAYLTECDILAERARQRR